MRNETETLLETKGIAMIDVQSFTDSITLRWAAWRDGAASTHKLLARDGNAINDILARHGVDAYVTPRGCVHSRRANFARYEVITNEKQEKVTGLRREINAALTKARGEFARVHFTEPVLCVEATHPAGPLPLPWEDAPLGKLKTLEMLLGNSYAHGKCRPATIHFADDTIAHVFGGGMAGCGKTMLLRNMVLSLALSTSPHAATFVILDGKNDKKLRALNELPHLPHGVTSGMADCADMLDRIIAEKDQRTLEDAKSELFVFIDELSVFVQGDKEIKAKVEILSNIGRGLGIHLIFYTQNPLAAKLGSDTKANVSVTIGGRVRTMSNADTIFGKGVNSGAERLPGRGSFLVMADGEDIERIQTYFIDDDDVPFEVEHVADRWVEAEAKPIARVGNPGPELPKGVSQAEIDRIIATYSLESIIGGAQLPTVSKADLLAFRDEKGKSESRATRYRWAGRVTKYLAENYI